MSTNLHSLEPQRVPWSPASNGVMQRACDCGNHTIASGGECNGCRKKRSSLQRATEESEFGVRNSGGAPPIVHDVLRSPGRPLDAATRNFMEPRFGYDFSSVRVHSDARAAESARSVNALAYTVGRDIVVQPQHYKPEASEGKRLLAHELTHVLQQGHGMLSPSHSPGGPGPTMQAKLEIGESNDVYEREADVVADKVMRMSDPKGPATSGISPATSRELTAQRQSHVVASTLASPFIQRQTPPQAPPPQPVAPVAPNPQQQPIIEAARAAAALRTQIALLRVRGIVPPGPSNRPDPGQRMQDRARRLARIMFQWDNPNMDQIEEVISSMVTRLTNPQVMVAGPGDPECSTRGGYVRGFRPPIVLCPTFFSSSAEQQIRTMIHESAHLARIGSASVAESYCVDFDCETSCGGFESADSWAHFIHCLSDQTPDQQTIIQPGRPGGGGGTP